MAAALLAETGLTVGVYSSPHLQRINERISRNGEPIDDDELAEVLTDLERLVPLTGVDPTYVADGAVAVVTNIGPDHTDFGEGWRRKVAEEKAGIIKPGSVLVLGE